MRTPTEYTSSPNPVAFDVRRHRITSAAIAARLRARREADAALARGDSERAAFYLVLERRRARLVLRLLSPGP